MLLKGIHKSNVKSISVAKERGLSIRQVVNEKPFRVSVYDISVDSQNGKCFSDFHENLAPNISPQELMYLFHF